MDDPVGRGVVDQKAPDRDGQVPSLKALEYAIDHGADVANMSYSIPDLGNARGVWRLAADNATAAGLVLVSGAGNFRQSQPVPVQMRIPEGIPSVIGVGGVDSTLVRTSFSSGGPVTWGDVEFYRDHPAPDGLIKPDVAGFPGPGYTVLRSTPTGGYLPADAGLGGNSFSGPQAAGVAALILSVEPELQAWEVKAILESTARELPPAGKDNGTGWGLLDAGAAVRTVLGRSSNGADRRRF